MHLTCGAPCELLLCTGCAAPTTQSAGKRRLRMHICTSPNMGDWPRSTLPSTLCTSLDRTCCAGMPGLPTSLTAPCSCRVSRSQLCKFNLHVAAAHLYAQERQRSWACFEELWVEDSCQLYKSITIYSSTTEPEVVMMNYVSTRLALAAARLADPTLLWFDEQL